MRTPQTRRASAINSPTSTAGRFVFARGITGISEQSATTTPSRPRTRPAPSQTASGSLVCAHGARADGMEVVGVVLGDRTVEARRDLGADQLPQRLGRSELPRPLDPLLDHGQVGAVRVGEVAVVDPRRRLRVGAGDVERAA